jgi:phosphatidylserine decarboxylase
VWDTTPVWQGTERVSKGLGTHSRNDYGEDVPPREKKASASTIRYVDRRTGEIAEEIVLGEPFVRFVYERMPGRALRRAFLTRPMVSKAYGRYQSHPVSRRSIAKVVKNLAIDMDEYEVPSEGFAHFNDFFTRKLRPGKRPVESDPDRLVSPADGRTFAYVDVQGDTMVPAKGRQVSIRELLKSDEEAKNFAHGTVLIVRLCPSDYHRFHFPCDGTAGPSKTLAGPLESVNPHALARGKAILDRNQRDVTYLESPRFGRIAYLEIGAMMVGTVVQTYRPGQVKAGDEKGYFQFGGSTVILVLQPGAIRVDDDLVENTRNGLETLLRMGEGIATSARPR